MEQLRGKDPEDRMSSLAGFPVGTARAEAISQAGGVDPGQVSAKGVFPQ